MMTKIVVFLIPVLFFSIPLSSISLEEKARRLTEKSSSKDEDHQEMEELDYRLKEKRKAIHDLQPKLWALSQKEKNQDSVSYNTLKDQLLTLQKELKALQEEWIEKSAAQQEGEFESVWHLPDTTVGQLVIDYNPGDCVYTMAPEIAQLKLHISSHISVPRESWGQLLELILATSGIGIKPLGPFVKQLYFLRLNQSGLTCFLDDRKELEALNAEQKVAFVVTPPPADMKRIMQFLERFSPQEQLGIQNLSNSIVIVGLAKEVQELLKIYDFISMPKLCQEFQLVSLEKGDSSEIASILISIFENEAPRNGDAGLSSDRPGGNYFPSNDTASGFRVMPLKHPASSLFLIGRPDQLEKALAIIKEIETKIGEVQEKSIFWYSCKHSDAEELAKVLSQVYNKLLSIPSKEASSKSNKIQVDVREANHKKIGPTISQRHPHDNLIVNPSMVNPLEQHKSSQSGEISEQFIVDTKTNSIIMVVEKYLLNKLKELLIKLDIPKKMVQIDVLLFEKKVSDDSSIGLSMLRTNSKVQHGFKSGIGWSDFDGEKSSHRRHGHGHNHDDDRGDRGKPGILDFAIKHVVHGGWIPPYELAYQFLLSQEDVQINANPSVTTVNQTAAKIAVVDQISINNGAPNAHGHSDKDSYSRAEYGIIIQITPTVHAKLDEEGDDPKFITLTTDVTFDSTRPSRNDRPDVTRRNIKNEVRVRDGETVILGGLRRKLSSGGKQSIPFLGELPGLGKLFSNTTLSDLSTEMFIFLTPHILSDSHEEWKQKRKQELMKRPGDTPEFFKEIEAAKQQKKKHLFESSMRMLLGEPDISPSSDKD